MALNVIKLNIIPVVVFSRRLFKPLIHSSGACDASRRHLRRADRVDPGVRIRFFTSHIKLHREHLHEDDLLGRLVQVETLALDENPEFVKGLAGHALLRLPGMMKKPERGP